MNAPHIHALNVPQQEAVTAPNIHLLILAGAGSGKTRVLVHRIAWLISTQAISPMEIFAVTFTNKAAHEMRSRVDTLLGSSTTGIWVGTFHSLAHRLLRMHFTQAHLPETFQIIDSEDQIRFIKRIITELNIDEDKFPPKQVQWFINSKKDEGLRPSHINIHQDAFTHTMTRIYDAYEQACQRSGLIDFAEILLRAHELLLNNPDILNHYVTRFKHILVDEFQDTNAIQYAWVRLLAGEKNKVMIVGDDDQSIYGWRGAKIENIHRFCRDFKEVKTIRLEQNYRSTGTILKAANTLIENNNARMGKDLWTEDGAGEKITLYAATNEYDEARFISKRIEQWHRAGNRLSDIAVLYRSNMQSRILEETLIQAAIPYRIYGGLRFFDRAEIKDALAYLRLAANPKDDAAFERVINKPTRGIGERTLENLREFARGNNCSLWEATQNQLNDGTAGGRGQQALSNFIQLINSFSQQIDLLPLHELTEHIIHASSLLTFYSKETGEKGRARIENLEELVNATRQFESDVAEEEKSLSPLNTFLAQAALESGDNQADAFEDSVQLMTLHSAKGLEFPLVFLSGCEEELFPHYMSSNDPDRLEEERRLCYVGITRAMKKLIMTYAEVRRLHGKEKYHRPSRFIREIPKELIEEVRLTSSSFSVKTQKISITQEEDISETHLRIGQRVRHPVFGEGAILNYEGRGEHTRLQIKFKSCGVKWLIVSYANLQAV